MSLGLSLEEYTQCSPAHEEHVGESLHLEEMLTKRGRQVGGMCVHKYTGEYGVVWGGKWAVF